MITNTGKTILAKYLIGSAPAYASHLALGVGPKPLGTSDTLGDYSGQTSLAFEALRIPITSRGYLYDEAGAANIVFSGELPGDQKYNFTEIGVYSGKSNPSAGSRESRTVYTFTESEGWEYHTGGTISSVGLVSGELTGASDDIINPTDLGGDEIVVFLGRSSDTTFSTQTRYEENEVPRFLDTALFIRGDISNITESAGEISYTVGDSHIHKNGLTLTFDKNSNQDELRFAFAVIKKDATQSEEAGRVRVIIEFASGDENSPTSYAKFEVNAATGDDDSSSPESGATINLVNNRYIVAKKTLSELTKSADFSWTNITSVRVFATVHETGSSTPSDKFYVALDGFRFENTTSQNPLYGLTGYTTIKTADGGGISKEINTSNIVEYRYGLDVA